MCPGWQSVDGRPPCELESAALNFRCFFRIKVRQMAHLCSVNNPKETHLLAFRESEFVVGRHPDCHLVIDMASISRRHACFTTNQADDFVRDLHSRNNTYVNGVAVDPDAAPVKLRDNDSVAFCDVEYTFRLGDPPTRQEGILFVDDDVESSSSTIMSKVGVSSSHGSLQPDGQSGGQAQCAAGNQPQLGRALALDEVLPQVLNSLFKIFVQADRGFIALRGPDGNAGPALVPAPARGCGRDDSGQPHDCQQGDGDAGGDSLGRRDDGRGVQQGAEHRGFSHSLHDVRAADGQPGQLDGRVADRHGPPGQAIPAGGPGSAAGGGEPGGHRHRQCADARTGPAPAGGRAGSGAGSGSPARVPARARGPKSQVTSSSTSIVRPTKSVATTSTTCDCRTAAWR